MSREKTTIGAKVSPRLKERIEEYQETEGFTNQSDAMRDLMQTGLEEHEQTAQTFPLPYAIMWFGTLVMFVPIQPGPGTDPETLFLMGTAIFLAGLVLGRTDILTRFRE